MKIALTIPVSTASCERFFSALKLVKTFLRNTMLDSRTSDLGVLYINKQRCRILENSTIIDLFKMKTNRAINFILPNF